MGQLSTGGKVLAIQSPSKEWGIRVDSPGMACVALAQPIRLKVYESEAAIRDLAAGYRSLEKTNSGFVGRGELTPVKGVVLRFEDRWSISGPALTLARKVTASGSAYGGFYSAVMLSSDQEFLFSDVKHFAPGMIYGGPEHLLDRAPGGMPNFRAGTFQVREDGFTIPVYGLYFGDGTSVAVLDPSPRGDTIAADSRDQEGTTLVDERFQFGALGATQRTEGGIDFGYWFPGSLETAQAMTSSAGPRSGPRRRRYHPFKDGLTQQYEVSFRFGRDESFHDFYISAWRWGWAALKPAVNYYDLAMVRRVLADQLASTVMTVGGRTGLPFLLDSLTGKLGDSLRYTDAIMGFVGKNLEGAALLLQDAESDASPRGEKHRQRGLAILDTFAHKVKVSPPDGEGFNLDTGQPAVTRADLYLAVHLRALTDDMRWALKAYQRELRQGREHPDWLFWCRQFGEWLLSQQRPDGSFPRSWRLGTGEIFDPSSTSSYNAMAFLATLNQVTGQQRFLAAARRAGDFCWMTYHSRDAYVGGTLDNPNIMDKEAGTLSLEGYLALYDATKETKWLHHAKAAADYAETWIYAWNIPMPEDEDNAILHWKKGVSTIGLNKINSTGFGGDQWMAGDVDKYAKVYAYTKDSHYLHVARILLHNTKNMLALPGRTYDLAGPGWQQEHWGMSPRRGIGAHRGWLPWVTVNHLEGILALEDADPVLFKQVAVKTE